MRADLVLTARAVHVEDECVRLEGVKLDDLPEQLLPSTIVRLYTLEALLDEIGENAARAYFGLGDEY